MTTATDRAQVETFLLARDLFLKPGGSILPSAGHIFFCPFTDEGLFNETEQKVGAEFWDRGLIPPGPVL